MSSHAPRYASTISKSFPQRQFLHLILRAFLEENRCSELERQVCPVVRQLSASNPVDEATAKSLWDEMREKLKPEVFDRLKLALHVRIAESLARKYHEGSDACNILVKMDQVRVYEQTVPPNAPLSAGISVVTQQVVDPRIAQQGAAPRIAQQVAAPRIAQQVVDPRIAQQGAAPRIAQQVAAPRIAQQAPVPLFARQGAAPIPGQPCRLPPKKADPPATKAEFEAILKLMRYSNGKRKLSDRAQATEDMLLNLGENPSADELIPIWDHFLRHMNGELLFVLKMLAEKTTEQTALMDRSEAEASQALTKAKEALTKADDAVIGAYSAGLDVDDAKRVARALVAKAEAKAEAAEAKAAEALAKAAEAEAEISQMKEEMTRLGEMVAKLSSEADRADAEAEADRAKAKAAQAMAALRSSPSKRKRDDDDEVDYVEGIGGQCASSSSDDD